MESREGQTKVPKFGINHRGHEKEPAELCMPMVRAMLSYQAEQAAHNCQGELVDQMKSGFAHLNVGQEETTELYMPMVRAMLSRQAEQAAPVSYTHLTLPTKA